MDFLVEVFKNTDAPSIIIAALALYIMNGAWNRTARRLEELILQNQKVIERNTAVIFAFLNSIGDDQAERMKRARDYLLDELGLTEG